MSRIITLLICFTGLFSKTIFGATVTINTNTTWSNITSGSGPSGVPNNADDVIVTGGATLTISSAATCNNLDIQSGTVNVTGVNFSVLQNLDISGTINFSSSTGTKSFNNITVNAGGTWNSAVACSFTVAGNLTVNGTINANNGTYTFTGAGKSIGGSTSITLRTLKSDGTLNNTGNLFVTGGLTGSGAFNQNSGSSLDIAASISVSTFDPSAANNTVTFSSSTTQSILGGLVYHHLVISNAGTSTLTNNLTVNGNLSITGGTLSTSIFSITGNAAGTMSMSSGTLLRIGSTTTANVVNFPSGFTTGNILLDPSSTVVYQGNYNQTISTEANYGNLTLSSGTGTFVKNCSAGTLTILGNLTISSTGITLDCGANNVVITGNVSGAGHLSLTSGNLNISGNFSNSGNFTTGSGVITYNGGSQFIRGTTYNDLVLSGTGIKTINRTTIINNPLIIPAGITLSSVNQSLTLNSTLTVNGSYLDNSTSGTVTFKGNVINNGDWNVSVAQNIVFQNGLENNGTFTSGGGVYTFSVNNQIINGTEPLVISGRVLISGIITVSNENDLTIIGDVNGNQTGSTLENATGVNLILGGNAFNVRGSLNASAPGNTVNYNSSGIYSLASSTYHHLIISGGGTGTMANGVVNGDLTISSGTLNSSGTIQGNVTGTFTLGAGCSLVLSSIGSSAFVNFPSNFTSSNIILDPSSIVEYNGNGSAQTISSVPTYGNLTITTGTMAAVKLSDGGDLIVAGDLTIDNGGSSCVLRLITGNLALNGNFEGDGGIRFSNGTFTLGGLWNNTGILTAGTGTVNFASTSTATIPPQDFFNLSSSSTGARVFSSSAPINIAGVFSTGTNSYTTTGSTIVMNGTVAQILPALDYENVTIDNFSGVTISGLVSVSGTLKLEAGVFDVTGGTLTILSTSTSSANIAKIETGASINGSVVLQRFMPGGRAGWVLLGTPIENSPISAWQDDFATSGFSGASGSAGGFVSVRNYVESSPGAFNNGYVNPVNASEIVAPGSARWAFVGTSPTVAPNITVDVSGTVFSGNFNFPVTFTNSGTPSADGWNLVGNPYPSTIDWDAASGWTKTNMQNAVYIWNAELGTNGAYASYVSGVGTGGGSRYIPHSQGFYVVASGASPVLSSTEDVKVNNNPSFMRVGPQEREFFHIRLENNGGKLLDEAAIRFHSEGTDGFDPNLDAWKPSLPDFIQSNSIASYSEGNAYAINTFGKLTSNMCIPLGVRVEKTGTYVFNFQNFNEFLGNIGSEWQDATIILEDKLTRQVSDLRSQSSFMFYAPDSNQDGRFFIRITPNSKSSENLIAAFKEINLLQDGNSPILFYHFTKPTNVQIDILNSLGQVLQSEHLAQLEKGSWSIPSQSLAYGTFLVRVKTDDRKEHVFRFVNVAKN